MNKTFEEIKERVGSGLTCGKYKIISTGDDIDVNSPAGITAWITSGGKANYMTGENYEDRLPYIDNAKKIIKALLEGSELPYLNEVKKAESKNQVDPNAELVEELVMANNKIHDLENSQFDNAVSKARLEGMVAVYERLMGEGVTRDR